MINKLRKIKSTDLPSPARAIGGPATVGVEYNNIAGANGGLVIVKDDENPPTRVVVAELDRTQTFTNKTLSTGTVFSASPAGDGAVQWAQVSITNAEMLALRATPKVLVAAPGAAKVLEFLSIVLLFDRTAVYTETADNMAVKFDSGTGLVVSEVIESTGFVDAATDAVNFASAVTALAVKAGLENKALVLHNTGDGEFGGGDAANVVRAKVSYKVWATGF